MTSNDNEHTHHADWPINTFSTEEEPGIIGEITVSRHRIGNVQNKVGTKY